MTNHPTEIVTNIISVCPIYLDVLLPCTPLRVIIAKEVINSGHDSDNCALVNQVIENCVMLGIH